jgi:hypothetical protein
MEILEVLKDAADFHVMEIGTPELLTFFSKLGSIQNGVIISCDQSLLVPFQR